jgi:hypothetical protein
MGRGLAAAGGCPELFEVKLYGVEKDHEWVTYSPGLIVPSVHDLNIRGICTEAEALLLVCGLVQAGYQRRLKLYAPQRGLKPLPSAVSDCVKAIVCGGGINAMLYT